VTGTYFVYVDCAPTPRQWEATIFPENGRFKPGKATLLLTAFGCEQGCDSTDVSRVVKLVA